MAIPFKPGLSATQQQSISNLVANKPDPSTWSTTDRNNWNYATNNAPVPTFTPAARSVVPSSAPSQTTPQPAPSQAPAASSGGGSSYDWDARTREAMASIPSGYSVISPSQASVVQNGSSTDFEDIRTVPRLVGGSVEVTYYAYPIPKATVVNAQGQRVVVRTDGRSGSRVPTAQDMFGQGYRLERAPGVPVEPFTTQSSPTQNTQTTGVIDQRSAPNVLLPTGEIVRPTDSRYSQALTVPGSIQVNAQTNQVIPGIVGNIQTFADGSQMDLSTGRNIDRPGSVSLTGQFTSQGSSPSGSPASQQNDNPAFAGVDTTGWTDSMRQSYEAMYNYTQTLARQGQIVNPNVTIDQGTIDRFTQQARDEVDPYYRQIFDQANQDLKTALESISSTYSGRVRDIGKAFGQNLENAQKSFASRGLEMSSDRDQAEANVARDARDALSDAERAAREQAQRVGTETERQVGSSNLTSERGALFTGSQPVLGRPGVYNLSAPNTTRSLFSAQGGVFGSDERNKAYDAEVRARDLLNSRQLLAASNTM